MSKYSDIAEILKTEIENGIFSGDGKLPTEYELVERFSVSRQTIRMAITTLKDAGLVHQVQGSGTYISQEKKRKRNTFCKSILVISSYISDYIFPSIIRGIEKEISQEGYRLNLVATENRVGLERRILDNVLRNQDVDGIIVEGTKTAFPTPNAQLYESLEELGIPVLFLHCSYPALKDVVVVGMDDYEGGRQAAETLVKEGCRRIGGIFKSDDRQGLQRYSGFIDGALENGIDLSTIQVRWFTTEDIENNSYNASRNQLEPFIAGGGIEGIVCYNDQVASALIKDCHSYNLKTPKIISFDKSFLCEVTQTYRSLGHRKEALGQLAAKKIMNMIQGQKETSAFLPWLPL